MDPQEDILMALLMEALRPYVGPADLDSLVLRKRGSQQRLVLTLSFGRVCWGREFEITKGNCLA